MKLAKFGADVFEGIGIARLCKALRSYDWIEEVIESISTNWKCILGNGWSDDARKSIFISFRSYSRIDSEF